MLHLAWETFFLSYFNNRIAFIQWIQVICDTIVSYDVTRNVAKQFLCINTLALTILFPWSIFFKIPVNYAGEYPTMLLDPLIYAGFKCFFGYLLYNISSGLFHFIYNLLSLYLLSFLNVNVHEVLNSMKRVFVVMLALFYYSTPMKPVTFYGITIALGGVSLYAYFKVRINYKD